MSAARLTLIDLEEVDSRRLRRLSGELTTVGLTPLLLSFRTPDTWQWGPGSGEIDSLEFCPRNGAFMNFAGGGHQLLAPGVSLDASSGHATVRKDEQGIVTIATCSSSQAKANNDTLPQCDQPVYSDCNECQWKKNNTFACWCNPGKPGNPNPNIYGSGGCQNGGDCIWTLVSALLLPYMDE